MANTPPQTIIRVFPKLDLPALQSIFATMLSNANVLQTKLEPLRGNDATEIERRMLALRWLEQLLPQYLLPSPAIAAMTSLSRYLDSGDAAEFSLARKLARLACRELSPDADPAISQASHLIFLLTQPRFSVTRLLGIAEMLENTLCWHAFAQHPETNWTEHFDRVSKVTTAGCAELISEFTSEFAQTKRESAAEFAPSLPKSRPGRAARSPAI